MEETEIRPRIRGINNPEFPGIKEMDFSHNGKILTARYPFYGLVNCSSLLTQIKEEGLREPTAPELVSFMEEYFGGEEPEAQEIKKIFGRGKHFIGFTGVLSMPFGVAYFIDYPKFKEGAIDKDDLLNRLGESRAEVPFESFKEEAVGWRRVAKHPYFIAWAGGEEGAEKIAKLASKHPSKEASVSSVTVWSDNRSLPKPTARITSLDSSAWAGYRLTVNSDKFGSIDHLNYTFGMLRE
jgi:hypothetical protein